MTNKKNKKLGKSPKNLTQAESTKDAKPLTQAESIKDAKQLTQPKSTKDAEALTQPKSTKDAEALTQPKSTMDIEHLNQHVKDAKHSKKNLTDVSQDMIEEEFQNFPRELCLQKALFCDVLFEEGAIVLKAIFNTFYCHKDNSTDGGKAPFPEWQKNVGKSNKELKRIFGQSKISREKSSPIDKNYDMVTYYRLITSLHEIFYRQIFCDDCKGKIENIYSYRNQVCHFGPLLKKPNAKCLRNLFRELLVCADKHLECKEYIGQALEELSKLVNKDEDKILLDYKNCINDIILDNPHLLLMRKGQFELKKKEITQSFAIPFYWIYNVSDERSFWEKGSDLFEPVAMNVFTNPYMLYHQKTLDSAELLKPDLNSNSTPQVIFVVGHGGCGKTTLCYHIFLEWQKKTEQPVMYKGLESMDLVVLIEMRSTSCKSLDMFLNEFMKETVLLNKKNLKSYLSKLNVLYIIDGFDEKNEENVKLVHDISKHLSPSNRVILCTRPERLTEAQTIFSDVPVDLTAIVNMVGFDMEGRNRFSCRFLDQEQVKSAHKSVNPEEFCQFLTEQEKSLKEYLSFPLTVALILLLWLQTSNLKVICTATNLYTQFFDMLTSKLKMARKYSSTKNCPINNRSVTAVLDVLARCAQSAVLSDNFQIEIACSSMRELDECCKEYDVDLDEFLSAYLQFVKDPDDKKRHYSFFHRTEMEFLTGKYLANKSMSSVVQEKGYEKLQMYYGVLPFLVGQLGATGKLDKYAPVIIELLQCMQVSTDNFNFYSKLVIESTTSNNHGSGCRRPFCSQLCDLISHKEWHLEAETVLSGLHLLLHCACLDLDLLVIDLQMSCDPDKAECLRYLKNNLSKLQGAFGHGKHCRKLDLCLYIQNHYEKKDAGVSDDYLSLVLGWTNLVKFTGAIGTEGIKHLSKFVYIKHLDLRMSKSDVFNDFVKKCFAECKKLKQLQLILDFPTKTEPSSLVPLDCVPLKVHTDVRLRFDRIARKNLPWALCVIDAICPKSLGGFDRVTFHSTNFNREKDADLIIEALKDKVFMKVIVTSHASSRGQFNIIQKDKCPFEFEFDDR